MREQGIVISFVLRTATVGGRHAHYFARDEAILHGRETLAGEFVQVEVIATFNVTSWPDAVWVFIVSPSGLVCTPYVIVCGPVRVKLSPELF